jgi:Acetyltransferase (GNAT) domain
LLARGSGTSLRVRKAYKAATVGERADSALFVHMIRFRRLSMPEAPWEQLDAMPDRAIYQTRAWIEFVSEAQGGEPVVAEIRAEMSQDSGILGYFSGVLIRKAGIPILGSPFPGWTTPYMGFNLLPGVSRSMVLPAFAKWAFGSLGCWHFEICDQSFSQEDAAGLGLQRGYYETGCTDLALSEDELFANMTSACRRCIRKAEKSGVQIEEASDDAFAGEYYEQLKDVFAKQGRTPTYGVERVRLLIKHLLPTGNLLLVRARSPEGLSIGTGIYPGFNGCAEMWGNASWRAHQIWRPNESLHWYAMRYWKKRGVKTFDWGGGVGYKEKFGVEVVRIPSFYRSRMRWMSTVRDAARSLYYKSRPLIARLQRNREG